MEEKELFNFGDKELNVNSLLNNINSNQSSYLNYYSNNIPDSDLFIEKVNYIKEGIKKGSITTNGEGVYYDANGKLLKDDKLMNIALHFVDVIAKEQSKKERALTKSELATKEEEKKRKQSELERQRIEREDAQRNIKPAFTPPDGWNVATSFAHSFNQNGQIPYDLLQQLVTTDSDGNPVYTDLHTQLDKNFDSISKQLEQFSGTESYINNINLFKNALKDGDLSPQDRFLGMELGFQNSELDKLNALLKYKIEPTNPVPHEEVIATSKPEVPVLEQNPLERDDVYQERVEKHKQDIQNIKNETIKALNIIQLNKFNSPIALKADTEEEFQNNLIKFINNSLLASPNSEFKRTVQKRGLGEYYEVPILTKKFTKEHLQYIDPKLYNELGLKFFSKYSKTKMYKHFKNLVDRQNAEKLKEQIAWDIENTKYDPIRDVSVKPDYYKEGGIIKAQKGAQTPWRLNFDGTNHLMDTIYGLFTKNSKSYDAKQLAETFNKLNSDEYKSLNFEDKNNTLGFKNWNTTFNQSGLNNLFGYNEGRSDYLGVTTKSRNNFINYLKTQGTINTGNGNLSWNSNSNLWEYTDQPVENPEEQEEKPEVKSEVKSEVEPVGSESKVESPKISDLTLKSLNLKKPVDFNSNGIINSLIGYGVNEIANAKKRDIQQTIPIYQEIAAPEKSFKTAYTYDLEKTKGEIMAEATNFQPITSDASVYYDARNKAIQNARAYTTKLDTVINDRVHQVVSDNQDIAFANAVSRTDNVNTNAKYRHDWEVEQKQGEVDYIEARNQSFQNLNKEIKHNIVTEARKRQKQRDAYVSKYLLTGITTNPSNYIDGWTKHHDLIWYKGQNGKLETDQEQIEYQQLLSVVNQASANIFAQYEKINYPGIGTLHTSNSLKEDYNPTKHGFTIRGAKGMKIDKHKIGNFINKLK